MKGVWQTCYLTLLNVIQVFITVFYILIADDLIKVHKFKPTLKWRQSFENYLKTMPPYYIGVSSRLLVRESETRKVLDRSYLCLTPSP